MKIEKIVMVMAERPYGTSNRKNPLQKDKCTRSMGNPMAKSPDENCHKQKHIKQAQHLTQLPCKKEITFLESCRVGKKIYTTSCKL